MAVRAGTSVSRSLISAPSLGEDTTAAPLHVKDGRCAALVNMLPARPGKVIQRGPITGYTAGITDNVNGGFWAYDNKLLVGLASAKLQVIDLTTTGPTLNLSYVPPGGVSAPQQPTSSCRLGSKVYGAPEPGSAHTITRWDGTNVAGGVAGIANGPTGSYGVAAHLARVFALGGSVPGTATPIYSDRLFWTDPGWDGTDNLAAWQDDVSGLVNQIILPDSVDAAVAAVVLGQTLYLIRRNSVLALYGTSPANFTIRRVADIGCLAPSTVLTYDGAVYFLSDGGFVRFDGSRARIVSGPIQDSLLPELAFGNIQFASAAWFPPDIITLVTTHKWFAYDVDSEAWSKWTSPALTGALGGAGLPSIVGSSADYRFAATPVVIARAELLGRPETATSSAVGHDGTLTIPCSMRTRVVPLASPPASSKLQRVLLEVVLMSSAGGVTATADIQDGDGTSLKTVTVNPTVGATRQRLVVDVFNETAELQVAWTLNGTTDQISAFEIHDAIVEHIPAAPTHG